jgi:branched-chain amino acid transport system permease protein
MIGGETTALASKRGGHVSAHRHSQLRRWQTGATAAGVALVLFVIPATATAYWLKAFIASVIFSIVAAGTGLLYGRVGMVSLCQVSLLGIGGWLTLRIGHATSLPFPVVLLLAGIGTCALGVVVGLPALRISGLYFALITLMAAGAFEVAFQSTGFPDGGHGFLGRVTGFSTRVPMRRPAIASSDAAYFRFAVLVALLLFLLAYVHLHTRPGRAWAAIRQSEAAAISSGVNVTLYKLWAFGLASFMTGIAGGLFGASIGQLDWSAFSAQQSALLFAAVLVGGAYSLAGAVVAGLFVQAGPVLLDTLHAPGNLILILFGVGVMTAIVTAPYGIAGQLEGVARAAFGRGQRARG